MGERVATVMNTPGCVAFWDFVQRETGPAQRFTAHVPPGVSNNYPLDAANYIQDYWQKGPSATYSSFPLLGRGPFGQAIRFCSEKDPDFRPVLSVPRARLHDSPLDIKGAGKSVSVVVWAIRESGNHALAGIWHEGTDLTTKTKTGPLKVEAGQRQYALFAGLEKEGAACGHISENGGGSFSSHYAQHKAFGREISQKVPANAPAERLDAAWHCFAMTFDANRQEITAWLDGHASDYWQENPKEDKKGLWPRYNAWLQSYLHSKPGRQPGEDPAFPADQYYTPPEVTPLAVQVLSETSSERVEVREFAYTRVKITLHKDAQGTFTEIARDLVALRMNPWWYPHGIYIPKDAVSGGPFTIGRVIHTSAAVGFTGWIGGVAVFDRALSAEELVKLTAVGCAKPLPAPVQSNR